MSSFDKNTFERLMNEAVQLHSEQQYEPALLLSTKAYELAPDGSTEQGRAARDNSARYDRLNQPDKAEIWARKAYAIHDSLVSNMEYPSRKAFRERSVSAMYVGVSGLRKFLDAQKAGGNVENYESLDFMHQAWSDLKSAKAQAYGVNQKIDQYEINAARRVSLAESLVGSKKAGLAIGVQAVALAFWSESPRLDTSNPNLSTKQRLQAKAKALLGGIAAFGVGLLNIPKAQKSQHLATAIASRTL